MYPFVIVIDLAKQKTLDDTKFILRLFNSYISSVPFVLLSLSTSTKVRCNRKKYAIFYKSSVDNVKCIKSDLVSVYNYTDRQYKKLSNSIAYFTVGKDGIMLVSEVKKQYMIDMITLYTNNYVV